MSTLPLSRPAGAAIRRHTYYVDRSLQLWLLVAMVALEIILVAGSTWIAHRRFSGIIEDSLYRVHMTQAEPILTRLAQEGFLMLGIFACVNVVALLIAAQVWSRHERAILDNFTLLVQKTRLLDFSADPESRARHEVVDLALRWRARERIRFSAIRDHLENLERAAASNHSPYSVRAEIEVLRALLG